MKRFGHGAKLLAHADRLRGCNAKRHSGFLNIQFEQPGAGGCSAQRAGGACDVPTTVVMLGVHGITYTAGHINANNQRINHLAA